MKEELVENIEKMIQETKIEILLKEEKLAELLAQLEERNNLES